MATLEWVPLKVSEFHHNEQDIVMVITLEVSASVTLMDWIL